MPPQPQRATPVHRLVWGVRGCATHRLFFFRMCGCVYVYVLVLYVCAVCVYVCVCVSVVIEYQQ